MKEFQKFKGNIFIIILLLLFAGCGNKSVLMPPKYEIVNEQRTQNSTNLRLVEYAVYKDSIYAKDSLRNVLKDLYNKNRDLLVDLNNHVVYGAYLFTSKEKALRDKSEWIARLIIFSGDSIPQLYYNERKIQSLQGLNDNTMSEDGIAYDKLKKYFADRNLDLCSFYLQLGDMEVNCIHRADTLYPNFGIKHDEYSEKLMKEERKKLAQKYNLADSIFITVAVFGMAYCK